jgi:hypothetical protein
VSVNELLPEPRPPGPWVDARACTCGASYEDFRAWPSFHDGAQRVRQVNGEGGGYRSRGPVLWAMRVLKLEAWYLEHLLCGQEARPCRSCEELCPWCSSSMAAAHGLVALGDQLETPHEQLESPTEP